MTLEELTKAGAIDAPEETSAKPEAPKGMTLEQLMKAGAVDAPEPKAPEASDPKGAMGEPDAMGNPTSLPSDTGNVEAATRGATSFIPFGKQAEAGFNTLPIVGTGKTYSENLSDVNARTAKLAEERPGPTNIGKGAGLAASMLAPGGIPVQAALGAAGAAGEANAEGKGVVDTLGAAGRGATLQGLAGPIAGKVVGGASGAASAGLKLAEKAAEHPVGKTLSSIAGAVGGYAHGGLWGAAEGAAGGHLLPKGIHTLSKLVEFAETNKWTSGQLARAVVALTQGAGTEIAHAP